MIDLESAAAILNVVVRDFNPFTSPDAPDSDVEALRALARRANWIADVAAAEARRRQAAADIAVQVQIAREGGAPERAAAERLAEHFAERMRLTEVVLNQLMDSRPVS